MSHRMLIALLTLGSLISTPALGRPRCKEALVSSEVWRNYISSVWQLSVLTLSKLPNRGVVVEIAPGMEPKIGLALKKTGFAGTLYIIEPESKSLDSITRTYRTLLPGAKIIPIERTLDAAIPELPEQVDAILSNHPLDDMIAGKALTTSRFQGFFRDHYEKGPEDTVSLWNALERDPVRLSEIKAEVVRDWVRLIERTRPSLLAIAQYESYYFHSNGIQQPDQHAWDILKTLKEQLPATPSPIHASLKRMDADADRWLVTTPFQGDLQSRLRQTPEAVRRLGDRTFVQATVRHLGPDEAELLYADRSTMSRAGVSATDQELMRHFAVEITDQRRPGGVYSTLYVDRQVDPTGVAMNGNQGSGRAGYLGQDFNVLGIGRTPLARAEKSSFHGNGFLDLEVGVKRVVNSVSVSRALRTGASAEFGLFILKEKYTDPSGDEMRRAMVVRMDQGTLDRPVHLLVDGSEIGAFEITRFAQDLGKQDAEKLIERIEHGAYSAGNISIRGGMIDFETVTAVSGRSPQYSLTGKWAGNLFGLEGIGQLEVIETLQKSPRTNPRALSMAKLKESFNRARKKQLQRRILDLLGCDPSLREQILSRFSEAVAQLTGAFEELSGKMYPDYLSMATFAKDRKPAHVFDFSRFFRLYPLIRQSSNRRAVMERAWQLLFNPGSFKEGDPQYLSPEVKSLLEAKHLVRDFRELEALRAQATGFIHAYESFLTDLETQGLLGSADEFIKRAYIINEERHYMSDPYATAFMSALVKAHEDGTLPLAQFRSIVAEMIAANDRLPGREGANRADMRIFKQGVMYRRMLPGGKHRLVFEPRSTELRSALDGWEMSLGNQRFKLQASSGDQGIELVGPELDSSSLTQSGQIIRIFRSGAPFALSDFSPIPRAAFSLKEQP